MVKRLGHAVPMENKYREEDRNIYGIDARNGHVCVDKPEVTNPKLEVTENDVEADRRKPGGVPLDRGWAWFVLLGACIEMTIVIGLAKSSGILFVAFQDQFRSSSSATSLISTVQNAVYSISALTVMTVLARRVPCRYLVMFGTILDGVSFIISSQATDIRFLLLSHGILQGFATAFMQPTTLTILGQYFDKRRGLANSIAVSGGSLGGLLLAPLITGLLATYGYRGCMLVLAGVILNACVSAALFRPPESYTKSDASRKDNNGTTENFLLKDKQINDTKGQVLRSPVVNGLRNGHALNGNVIKASNGSAAVDPRLLGSEPLLSGMPMHHRKRTSTESSGNVRLFRQFSHDDRYSHTSREYMAGSYMDIPGFIDTTKVNDRENTSTTKDTPHKLGICSVCKTLTDLFDFQLFKDPVFVLMEIAFGLSCAGYALTTVFIVPYAREVGVDSSGVATIVTIFSAIDLCARIGAGVIADLHIIRRSTMIGICAVIVSIASFLLRFYTSYGLVVFYAVVLGLFTGSYFALFAVIIVDYMTIAKLHSCLGFTTLFHGTSVAIGFIISGILRDTTGSYVASFYFLGAEILVGGLILLSLPYVEKLRDRRRHNLKEMTGT